MTEKIRIASVDTKKMSPLDLTIYRKNRQILTKAISLQKLWKDAVTPSEKKETKRLTIQLINESCESIEKSCAFLGEISTPYILSRLKKQLEETLKEILERYNIPAPTTKNNNPPLEYHITEYLYDDLDLWYNCKFK